jgi:hypothetical protein
MTEAPDNKAPEPAPQPASPEPQPETAKPASYRELPLDTRLLSEAVIELNISRKNVGIYPPGHVQITSSIERAYSVLLRLFEIREDMTLGVAKDTLFVGQDYFDQRNPVYRDFALSLNNQGIAAIMFIRGLVRDELVRFHRIITTKPEEIRANGGIAAVVDEAGIPHIRVIPIDYDSFHLTEEDEIFKAQSRTVAQAAEKAADKPAGGLWMDFVSLISAGTLARPGEGVSMKDATVIDPAELAKLLNEKRLNPAAAVKTYDTIISSHMRSKAEKRPTREQSETLRNMNALIEDLHPDLRKQFLSSAFKNLSENPAGAGTEEVLGGMTDDLIVDMLRQASAEGREISPSLTGMLSKLANIRDTTRQRGRERPQQATAERPRRTMAPDFLPEQMENLFKREKYEHYVEEEYDRMLKHVSERAETMAASKATKFPVREYLRSFENEHLDFQIGRAVVAFMEEKIDEEDYREFAKKLASLVPDLLKSGNFSLLIDILTTLRWHLTDKQADGCRTSAMEVLGILWQPDFIARSVAAFDSWAQSKARPAGEFLLALGPATLPGLLDLYAADASPGGRRVVFDLLAAFGEPAVAEALKRLGDPRPHYVRNLLMLLRRAGTRSVLAQVRPLLKHADVRIRLEALAVLLRFKDAAANDLLRREILSKDPDVASQAAFLAGQYRVSAVVDNLRALLKGTILFESDYAVNEELIRALGEIGDPRAVPDLEKLARSTFSLHPAAMARMKQTLFASLGQYPREKIRTLLQIGERSGDEQVRKECRKLAEQA